MQIQRRPVLMAAIAVVPDPAVLSKIISPGLEYVLIKYSHSSIGFWVGCSLSPELPSLFSTGNCRTVVGARVSSAPAYRLGCCAPSFSELAPRPRAVRPVWPFVRWGLYVHRRSQNTP